MKHQNVNQELLDQYSRAIADRYEITLTLQHAKTDCDFDLARNISNVCTIGKFFCVKRIGGEFSNT